MIELNEPIKLLTIALRRQHKMKLPDALIAASALALQLTLVTNNIKDFQKIPNLKLLNPWID